MGEIHKFRADRRRSAARLMRSSALGALAAMITPNVAFAQESAVSEQSVENNQNRLGDVIVTARRRPERSQDTPISMTAISGEQLEALNIVRLEGITQLAPSLRITQASGSANAPAVFIRGIGTISTALYVEPSVGIYVDGIYTPRPSGNTFDLPDIASIEVLRGPQGTLFGRNTTGGAIILNTVAPTMESGLRASIQYGSDNELVASAVVQTGQLGETPFAMRFSAQTHSRDGWVGVPDPNQSVWGGALNAQGFGAALRGQTNNLTLDLRIRYNNVTSYTGWEALAGTANGVAYFGGNAASLPPPFPIGVGPRDFTYRDPRTTGRSNVQTYTASGTVEWSPSAALTLRSITGFTVIDQVLRANLGGGATQRTVLNPTVPGQTVEWVSPHTTPTNPGHQDQFTQEVQALGTVGDFNYLLGLYYYDERVRENITTIINSPTSATASIRLNRSTTFTINSQSYAAFAQFGWRPAFAEGRLEVVGGIRYTKDDKSLNSISVSRTTTTTTLTQARKDNWDNVGWLASASYRINSDVLVYARASSAYRSGGYNAPSVGVPPFAPETATSYEIGLKSDLFDRHLRFNLSAYQTDYNDLQVNGYNITTNTNLLTNAGQARFRGFEAETQVVLGNLRADANVGYVDPKFLEYTLAVGGVPTNVANVARFGFVPHWTYHFGAQYRIGIDGDTSLTLRGDYTGTSNSTTYTVIATAPNTAKVPLTGRQQDLSLRATLETNWNGHRITGQVFGENITGHRYLTFVSDFGAILTGVWNRPSHYGVRLGVDF
jgi:iron complex outermembrane receptor protein